MNTALKLEIPPGATTVPTIHALIVHGSRKPSRRPDIVPENDTHWRGDMEQMQKSK